MPSDLTDAEWEILEPLLPQRATLGRPPLWDYRQIVEAIPYLLRGGLPWRMLLPGLFPPITTVQHYFYRWSAMGVWKSINHALLLMAREAAGRGRAAPPLLEIATILAMMPVGLSIILGRLPTIERAPRWLKTWWFRKMPPESSAYWRLRSGSRPDLLLREAQTYPESPPQGDPI